MVLNYLINHYKQNKLSLYNISSYTLKDLQEIAENYDN